MGGDAAHDRRRKPADGRPLSGKDARDVRRDERGRFAKVVDAGASLSTDRRRDAKSEVKPGQGDRGDRRSR
jgi:hypothetical protein